MIVEPTYLPDVKLLHLQRDRDERGFFSEIRSRLALGNVGVDCDAMFEPDCNHPTTISRSVPCPTFS